MKFLAIDDNAQMPLRYIVVDDERLTQIREYLDGDLPRLFEITDNDIITELEEVYSSGTMKVDKYGNFYHIEDSPVPWGKCLIIVD